MDNKKNDSPETQCEKCESLPTLPTGVTFKVARLDGGMRRFRTGLRAIGGIESALD